MTELAAPQISSLMEALPGIAAVLRSPVANAMVALTRAAADLEEFQLADAEELLRFGVRRNLLTPEEVDKVLEELREVAAKRPHPPQPKKAPPPKPVPKVPHRPKGIQLKPMPRRPPPPPPPPPVKAKPRSAAPAHPAPKKASRPAPKPKPKAPHRKAAAKPRTRTRSGRR